jgi:hypothetical protein
MGGVGIDYGRGLVNIDQSTGIRYGVIPANAVEYWHDVAEVDYGPPTYPRCGSESIAEFEPRRGSKKRAALVAQAAEVGGFDLARCKACGEISDGDELCGESCMTFVHSGGVEAFCGEDGDIFIVASPYYAHAAFCSPCAPGACYLLNEHGDGAKAYCLGHDWFDDGGAPYRVFSVATGEEVMP